MLQLHVTVLFYLENSWKIHLRGPAQGVGGVGAWRERALALWLLFLYVFFFFLPLGLPYVNWASQECCLFYLRSSLRSSDLSLFYFRWLFPSLSFSHYHSGLLFPTLTTQHNHLILCRPLLHLPSIFPSIRVVKGKKRCCCCC